MANRIDRFGDAYKQMVVRLSDGSLYYTKCNMCEEDYIHMPQWQISRNKTFQRDGFRCKQCGSAMNLNCHHIRYPSVWGEEKLEDLVTLCDECHKKIHK